MLEILLKVGYMEKGHAVSRRVAPFTHGALMRKIILNSDLKTCFVSSGVSEPQYEQLLPPSTTAAPDITFCYRSITLSLQELRQVSRCQRVT